MASVIRSQFVHWTVVIPIVAIFALVLTWGRELSTFAVVVVAAFLAGAVLAAVHHAEVVAHKVGEPLGSLVLAIAVTVIEVGLIVMLMISGGPETQSLARDTVFAAVMITCNGILGLSLLLGAIHRRVALFKPEGTGAALATVATLAALSLVLPTFTTASPVRILAGTACLCSRRIAGVVRALRPHANPPTPRLLSANHHRGQSRRRRRTR
jgi:Ca2+:H+ antiporter